LAEVGGEEADPRHDGTDEQDEPLGGQARGEELEPQRGAPDAEQECEPGL
jgi:hypothetical protein